MVTLVEINILGIVVSWEYESCIALDEEINAGDLLIIYKQELIFVDSHWF